MRDNARFRAALADTFAMVVFSFVTGMIIEIMVSGLSFEQSLMSRLISIPVNVIIAWPYGFFRDRVIRMARSLSPKRRVKSLADFLAYVVFQSPIYILVLLAVGADVEQIFTAVTSNALISGILGVVYGVFLEQCRKWFNVQSEPVAA